VQDLVFLIVTTGDARAYRWKMSRQICRLFKGAKTGTTNTTIFQNNMSLSWKA
jgi:hypothetical protein